MRVYSFSAWKNLQQGASYYENTDIDLDNIQNSKAFTREGHQIIFERIILATGYTKIYPAIKKKCRIDRIYAVCSEPLVGKSILKSNTGIQNGSKSSTVMINHMLK